MARTRTGDHTGDNFITGDQDGDPHLDGSVMYVDGDGRIDFADGGRVDKVILTAVDRTLTVADAGATVIVTAADKVITLPATVAGMVVTVVTGAVSGGTGTSVSPAAADKIIGNGFTAADDKDAINTGATDVLGDSITLIGDGVDGWYVLNVVGTWERQA